MDAKHYLSSVERMDTSDYEWKMTSELSNIDENDELAAVPQRPRRTSIRNIAIEQLAHFNDCDGHNESPKHKDVKSKPVKKNRPQLKVKVWSADFDNDLAEQIPATPAIRTETTESGDLILGKFCIGEHGLQVLNEDGNSPRNVSFTSRTDFAEVRTLGTGTHGIIVEALHIPSMTLVAVKMLSVNTAEHMKTVNSELHVLHQNLVKLKLVDDMLSETDKQRQSRCGTEMSNATSIERLGRLTGSVGTDDIAVDSLDDIFGPSPRGNGEPDGGMWGETIDNLIGNSTTAESLVKVSCIDGEVVGSKPGKVSSSDRHGSSPAHCSNGPSGVSEGIVLAHPGDAPSVAMQVPYLRHFSYSEFSDGRCPHVLGMFDAFLDPASGMVNLVLEYMDGGSLQNIVDNGGCDNEGVLASIAYQMMAGLEFLHFNKQLHRDIKPGNILLNCEGSVKVADFGIAKVLSETGTHHKHNSFIGSIHYMAPERISNTSGGYSYPADVWSAGMSLLAVAKGRYPLDESARARNEGGPKDMEFWDLVEYICHQPTPVPGPDFSDDFTDFIACCLQKAPEDRLTATQLLDHRFLMKRHSPVEFGQSQVELLSGIIPDGTNITDVTSAIEEDGGYNDDSFHGTSPSCCVEGEVYNGVPLLSNVRTSSTAQPSVKVISKSEAQLAELVEDAVTSVSRGNSCQYISRENTDRYDSDECGELESDVDEIISSLQDACFGERWDSLGMSDNAEHFSSRHAIIEIRLRHLRTILEKVQQKYALVEGLNHSQKNALMLASQRLPDSTIGFQKQHSSVSCSSEEGSATVSSSFLSDRMVLLPAMEGKGLVMWEKFARQLHLPCSTVMRFARDVVDVRYFKES